MIATLPDTASADRTPMPAPSNRTRLGPLALWGLVAFHLTGTLGPAFVVGSARALGLRAPFVIPSPNTALGWAADLALLSGASCLVAAVAYTALLHRLSAIRSLRAGAALTALCHILVLATLCGSAPQQTALSQGSLLPSSTLLAAVSAVASIFCFGLIAIRRSSAARMVEWSGRSRWSGSGL